MKTNHVSLNRPILIVSLLAMFMIWGFIFLQKSGFSFGYADVVIFLLFFGSAIVLFFNSFRKAKLAKEGIPAEDELSRYHTFAAGYYTFFISIGIWLLILLLQDHFPDNDTMIGLGLSSSICVFIIISWVFNKRGIPHHEK